MTARLMLIRVSFRHLIPVASTALGSCRLHPALAAKGRQTLTVTLVLRVSVHKALKVLRATRMLMSVHQLHVKTVGHAESQLCSQRFIQACTSVSVLLVGTAITARRTKMSVPFFLRRLGVCIQRQL